MKLYETLTAENWGKGHGPFPPPQGRECIATLLAPQCGVRWMSSPEYRRLEEAIGLLYPGRGGQWNHPHVFNDHPDTTLDDVLRVCKVADV